MDLIPEPRLFIHNWFLPSIADDLLSGSGLGDRLTPKQRSLVLVAGLGLAAAGALAALGGAALNRGGKTDVAQGVIHATTAAPTVVTSSR